jgi:hypothetical protein
MIRAVPVWGYFEELGRSIGLKFFYEKTKFQIIKIWLQFECCIGQIGHVG